MIAKPRSHGIRRRDTSRMLSLGFILRQAQDEASTGSWFETAFGLLTMRCERFSNVKPHGELVEPWAASFFSSLRAKKQGLSSLRVRPEKCEAVFR